MDTSPSWDDSVAGFSEAASWFVRTVTLVDGRWAEPASVSGTYAAWSATPAGRC